MNLKIEGAQKTPKKSKQKKSTLRHSIIKLSSKRKRDILKEAREKQLVTCNSHKTINRFFFSKKPCRSQGSGMIYSKCKKCQPRIIYLAKLSFKNEGKINTFPNKQTLKASVTIRTALQEMLKGILQDETKGYSRVYHGIRK